jgi:hypothetical protein
MEKKKLNLTELEVRSFVTGPDVKGGTFHPGGTLRPTNGTCGPTNTCTYPEQICTFTGGTDTLDPATCTHADVCW